MYSKIFNDDSFSQEFIKSVKKFLTNIKNDVPSGQGGSANTPDMNGAV